MLFSIIIPVYQAEKTIRTCLNSLLGQNYEDFEAILIDDGSTDRSGIICEEYVNKDARFRYIRKENEGPSAARNIGLELAQGEYIFFLDSDDRYCETYLEGFSRLISEYRDVDSFWCGFTTISDDPSENGSGAALSQNESICLYDRTELMALHANKFFAPLWNKAFRSSIIKENSLLMDRNLSLGEDLLFNLEYLDVCSNNRILVWNSPEYIYYSFSKDSLNHKFRPDLYEIYSILRSKILFYLQKWDAPEEQIVKYDTMTFYMLEQVIMNYQHPLCSLSEKEKKEAIKTILRSKDFQDSLQKGQITIHPLFRFAYRSKQTALVRLMDKLFNLKTKLKRLPERP